MKKSIAVALFVASIGHAAIGIVVEADSGRIPISPYIYGKNGSGVSDAPAKPSQESAGSAVFLAKEAGLRMARENAGNNLTKYNWRKKITCHPDWYNNVYNHDWDFSANELKSKLPGVQGFYGFQLTGWVASNTNNNFNDWGFFKQYGFNASAGLNLAGGGLANADGKSAIQLGDPTKYNEPWPADSTTGILPHWFGPSGLGLDSTKLRYWNMDNEMEIWDGTHDDVNPALNGGHKITPEEAVQRWVAVAKAACKHFPGIKLVGPASSDEWHIYNWPTGSVSYKGASYCWPEYLIKRLAEVQDSTGVRMIDVYDLHLYFSANSPEVIQNQYRLLWDTTYLDPNANGVRTAAGGWNANEKHQMAFHRIEGWLDKYFGKGHGIKVGASESGLRSVPSNPSETAVWYASLLGTFADHGAELFTPWGWDTGMWEVLHLYSRYAKNIRVQSTSTTDSLVSAYSSITPKNDSMVVILVNRSNAAQSASVSLKGFVPNGNGTSLQLADLNGETFVSHTQNALQSGTVTVANGATSLSLPAYSITALVFKANIPQSSSSSSIPQSSSSVSSSSSNVSSSSSNVSSSSSSESLSSSSSIAGSSSSSQTLATAMPREEISYAVKFTHEGVRVEGTDGSESIHVFDIKGNRLLQMASTIGSTEVKIEQRGALFVQIKKGNQTRWSFVPRL